MPFCPQCGTQNESEAAFYGACGARIEGEALPPSTRPHAPPARITAGRWSAFGGLVLAAAAVVGALALYDAAANDGDWADSLFGGGDDKPLVSAPSPTPEATVRLVPTVEPAQSPQPTIEPTPTEEPTVAPPAPGFATPEAAIAAFLESDGLEYAGDCEGINLDTDIGAYCTFMWEDAFGTRTYLAGLTFSEPDTWLLVSRSGEGDDWTVVDSADVAPAPAELVPPWP